MKKKMEHLNAEEIKEKSTKTISEFKSFIAKGNVIDLAVGVIIGSAFGKIVSSIVDDIIMPVIGVIIGGIDFTNLSIKVGEATITYGTFIQNIIDFLIIALFCKAIKFLISNFASLYVLEGFIIIIKFPLIFFRKFLLINFEIIKFLYFFSKFCFEIIINLSNSLLRNLLNNELLKLNSLSKHIIEVSLEISVIFITSS